MNARVIWTGRAQQPALAVPCSICGAFIGKPCRTLYGQGDAREPHTQRIMVAEAHGFTWAPGARPEPAALPRGHVAGELRPQTQGDLLDTYDGAAMR